MTRCSALALVCALSFTATAATPSEPTKPQRVHLSALITNPERYDGKQVQVVAWGVIEYEGAGLYHSEGDFKHVVTEGGVGLDIPNETKPGIELPQGSPGEYRGYMTVRGTFRAGDNVRGFAGVITQISYLHLNLQPVIH